MRIKVRHETTYTYRQPAASAVQLMRLTPRSCANQFVRHWRVEVDADARLEKGEDAHGNISHMVFIEGPSERIRIAINGEVDTTDLMGVVGSTLERQPAQVFLRPTPLSEASAEIRAFARECVAGEGGDRLATLHRITSTLHGEMRFDPAATTAMTAAADAYRARHGVCQDFAHVLIAAARSLAIPARYVSGYFLRSDRTDQDAGHAWAEAYLAGLGWVAFDPANGTCITDRYVRVAVGSDAWEAAPVRGAQIGGRDEALVVAIDVRQGRAIVEG